MSYGDYSGYYSQYYQQAAQGTGMAAATTYNTGYGTTSATVPNAAASAAYSAAAATNSQPPAAQYPNYASYASYASSYSSAPPSSSTRGTYPGSYPQNSTSYSRPPPAFLTGANSASGATVDMSQYQKYDGKKRSFEQSSGGGRGRGRDRGGLNKRPKSNFEDRPPRFPPPRELEEWECRDDSKIPVDKTLIDKRFNFWNLPSAAKVLLVSNIHSSVAHPRSLFNLFSFYGDVLRVKILPKNVTTALIEFTTATFACIARNHLDNFVVNGQKLVVSFSRFPQIKKPEECGKPDDGYTEDFSDASFDKMRRFCKDELYIVNMKRIIYPTACLFVNNIPGGTTPNQIKHMLVDTGLDVEDVVAIKNAKDRKQQTSDGPSRTMVFLQMLSKSDAVVGMALVNGALATAGVPAGIRVSFSKWTVKDEQEKLKTDKKIVSVPNDQPLH